MAKTSFKSVTYFPIKIKPWLRNPVKYENPARKVPATSKGWVKWHNCVEKNLLLCPHADHLITNLRQINLYMNTVSFKSVTYFSIENETLASKSWLLIHNALAISPIPKDLQSSFSSLKNVTW